MSSERDEGFFEKGLCTVGVAESRAINHSSSLAYIYVALYHFHSWKIKREKKTIVRMVAEFMYVLCIYIYSPKWLPKVSQSIPEQTICTSTNSSSVKNIHQKDTWGGDKPTSLVTQVPKKKEKKNWREKKSTFNFENIKKKVKPYSKSPAPLVQPCHQAEEEK